MPKKVVLGGTFDQIHMGHVKLIEKALEEGNVTIGLVSDEMLEEWKPEVKKTYEERKKNLENFLLDKGNWEIVRISDPYKKAVEGDFDTLVVSSETKERGEEINKRREEIGKEPLKIIEVKPVVAEDFLPISSTRIRNGEINEYGDRLQPVKIILEYKEPEEYEAVKELMRGFFDCDISKRNKSLNKKLNNISKGFDYKIDLTLKNVDIGKGQFIMEKAVIKDKLGFSSSGNSPGLRVPDDWDRSKNKIELFNSIKLFKDDSEGDINTIDMVPNGGIGKKGYIKSALVEALLPRMKGDLYK